MRWPVPAELRRGPFTVDDARRSGLTWEALQSRAWTRISYGQYAWSGLRHDVMLKLRGVFARFSIRFAFSGNTAGWLHRVDLPPCEPIEVTIERNVSARSRAGVKVRRAELSEKDVVMVSGFPTTSVLRTLRDLGSRRDLTESVVAIDMALHARLVDMATLSEFVIANPGIYGIKRLRRSIALADGGAESPMETRLRLALVTAKLPPPCTQVDLSDRSGRFIGRVDMYYPDRRMVIEYDGDNHRQRMAADLRRQNALINAGYHVLRFSAADLYAPASIAAQVRGAREVLPRHPG